MMSTIFAGSGATIREHAEHSFRNFARVVVVGLISVSVYALAISSAEALTIGSFDAARVANLSLLEGTGVSISPAQASVAANFPGATVTATNTLTAGYLSTVDVMILNSISQPASVASPVTLSGAEQTALLNYVLGGGGAVIFTDNDSYSGGADASNESFLDPFGLDAAGTGAAPSYPFGVHNPPVTNPGHPIMADTYGFGSVTFPLFFAFGAYDNLGPDATELAHIAPPLDSPGIAVIDPGVLGAGSGAVVFMSDNSPFFGNFVSDHNEQLVLNSIAYAAGIPEPASASLLVICLVVCVFGRAGRVRAW